MGHMGAAASSSPGSLLERISLRITWDATARDRSAAYQIGREVARILGSVGFRSAVPLFAHGMSLAPAGSQRLYLRQKEQKRRGVLHDSKGNLWEITQEIDAPPAE